MLSDWVKTAQDVNRPLGRKRFGKLLKGHIFSPGMIKGRQQKIKDVSEDNVKGLDI